MQGQQFARELARQVDSVVTVQAWEIQQAANKAAGGQLCLPPVFQVIACNEPRVKQPEGEQQQQQPASGAPTPQSASAAPAAALRPLRHPQQKVRVDSDSACRAGGGTA